MLFFYTLRRSIMTKTSLAALLLFGLGLQPQGLTGKIQGVVAAANSNQPLSGARVTLTSVTAPTVTSGSAVITGAIGGIPADSTIVGSSASASRFSASVTTDADGRFSFQNVEVGLYSLNVLRDGYARQSYGQRVPGGPASAIRVVAGQPVKANINLLPAGNISGVIRGRDGEAQTGVPVQLLRATYSSTGQRTFQVEGTSRTNDRGEYRLYWITPGRYYVSAGTVHGPNRSLTANAPIASPNEIPERSFTFTYYPGVADAVGAALIDVNPGAELRGVDFTVAGQELRRIRGRILDATTGAPPRAVGLSLAYRTLAGSSGSFNAGEKYDAKTGEFELRNIPAGSYVVQAVASDDIPLHESETLLRVGPLATRPNARVPVVVTASDLDGVSLILNAGVMIPGRITVEESTLTSVEGWNRIRVPLKPTLDSSFGPGSQPAAPVPQQPHADGGFEVLGVSPGEFSVGPLTGLPSGFYIKSARFNNQDVLSQPLRFSGGVGGALEIVISSKAGQLEGTATSNRAATAGARVVLVPERDRGRTDLYKTTAADAAGHFTFRNIPPGDYRVFGWEALESYAYFDRELLRRVESQSVPVHVSESAASNITVNVIAAAQ
jgi:hypothetical protein